MTPEEIAFIKEKICPLIESGDASLLLGAGFSYKNPSVAGSLPDGTELRDLLLKACGRQPGPKTNLKDAYNYASRNLPTFNDFLINCFTVRKVHPWQEKIFQYVWNRVFTTNIDNVLDVALENTRKAGRLAADFQIFNYCDEGITSNSIGTVPIITIHGTIQEAEKGFVFDNAEYAEVAANRILDWHNELAAKILVGGVIVIGNQLDESDIDTYIAAREKLYPQKEKSESRNWIVMPNPDEIKRDNYIAAGYEVIDATAEDFFAIVFSTATPKRIDEILIDKIPALKRNQINLKAMVWFKEAFKLVLEEREAAGRETGILRHFISGAYPSWFYIEHGAYANTPKIVELTREISKQITLPQARARLLHVIGPSGSGKTTAIKAALRVLSQTYRYIYEYSSENGVDIEFLKTILTRFTEKAIIVFYSAADFYYAVNALSVILMDDERPTVLFILEDRIYDHRKNRRHLLDCQSISTNFMFGHLSFGDAEAIAKKLDIMGVKFDNFSDLPIARRASQILDTEKGFRGDLLSTLFSLTTNQNFEEKIYQEYQSIENEDARRILTYVAIVNSFGIGVPSNYVASTLRISFDKLVSLLNEDLSGILQLNEQKTIICRHRVIAECYLKTCINGTGNVELIKDSLEFLSRQFNVDDIKHHPLAYQIYKRMISLDFLREIFSAATWKTDAERTYHEAQRYFREDGIFWLHFGRFYKKTDRLDLAISCFRTGLEFYESFQTRHSLGTTLLEKYLLEKCVDQELFEEGVKLLEHERLARGTSDAYPTTTLCGQLLRIVEYRKEPTIMARLVEHMNFGIRHFKEDDGFRQIMHRWTKLNSPNK